MDNIKKTDTVYGFLWEKNKGISPVREWHFNKVQEAVRETIVRGALGIDIGSGCGYDTYIMAKNNPSVKIVSIDISDGVYTNLKLNHDLQNVYVIKGSVMDAPLKEGIFDFVYSFGVLHHTPDPKKCLSEIARILKKESPVFLYLYEDHSENAIKYVAVRIIRLLRNITVRMPPKAIYFFCWLFSPIVFIVFSVPAKILGKFALTRRLANNIPFNFGRGFFSLWGDLYDRFSAPIELRFSREGLSKLLENAGFSDIQFTRLKAAAGLVAWASKI